MLWYTEFWLKQRAENCLWILTDSKFLLLFTQKSGVIELVSFLAFFTLAIPLLSFTKRMFTGKEKLFGIMQCLFAAMLGLYCLNNPARGVERGFRCIRQDFSHRDALESRFNPELRFSWLRRHLAVLCKSGTWLPQCRPSTPTLYHTIDTHTESSNKRARFTVTNLYYFRVTLIKKFIDYSNTGIYRIFISAAKVLKLGRFLSSSTSYGMLR